MEHPAREARDYPRKIDPPRRGRKPLSAVQCGSTVVAIFAAILCNRLALGMAFGESNTESTVVTPAGSVSAGPELSPPTAEVPRLRPPSVVEQTDTCYSLECNLTASVILNRMDAKVNPCDNFYRFACGGFIDSTIIPDDRTAVDEFTTVNDTVAEQLRTILESESEPEERESDRVTKNFYNSCMNTTPSAWDAVYAIFWHSQFFPWPLLHDDQWQVTETDVPDPDYFINVTTGSNDNASLRMKIPQIGMSSLDFRKFLLRGIDDKNVQTYYEHMVDIAVMLGAERSRASIELMEVLRYDIKMAEISVLDEKPISMTVAEFKKTYPDVNWRDLFEFINVKIIDSVGTEDNVTDNDIVIVEMPNYISKVIELMNNSSGRLKINYIFWKQIEKHAYYSNKAMKRRGLAESTKNVPRWKACVNEVYKMENSFIHSMYARKYLANAEAKKNVRNIFENLKRQLIDDIQQANWMDEKTQRRAVEKIEAMDSYLGYDFEAVDDETSRETLIKMNDRLKLIHNYTAYYNKNESKELPNWMNGTAEENINPLSYVQIKALPRPNTINIAPGVFQGLLFNNDRPAYVNYGRLGFVLAHEINHGFDRGGRRINKNGGIDDWMTPSTAEEFFKRSKCLTDQYNNYTDKQTGLKLDGVATEIENFCDNGGMKLAYRTYGNRVKKNQTERKLPGLDYTANQMFWISTASLMCAKYKLEYIKEMFEDSSKYPLDEYRVVGPLSNMPEFSKDFNCPMGSPMNPSKKCLVW